MKFNKNNEEEIYLSFLEKMKKYNLKGIGIFEILIGSLVSVICANIDIISLKILSSIFFSAGIIELGLYFVLKANKI